MNAPVSRRALSVSALLPLLASLTLWVSCQSNVSKGTPSMPKPARVLTIVTPHSEAIRETFEYGFWEWYLKRADTPVRIEWIDRGTPQCVEYIRQVPELRAHGAPTKIPDVMFGGGIADHQELAEARLSRSIDLGDAVATIPADIAGSPTRDPQGHWYATAMNSFGIIYNAQACAARGIAAPQTWADLADPRFFGWIAVADPRASGSHRECMLLVLQHEGWDAGWATLLKVLANARALDLRSGDALRQVRCGTALASFAANFDGLGLSTETSGAVQYVDPVNATLATPDVASVLSTAAEPELAVDFLKFLLSPEGQALWSVTAAHRGGTGSTLYHYPIVPATYTERAGHLSVERNPLTTNFGLRPAPAELRWQRATLGAVLGAACDDGNHVRLQRAWGALIHANLPARDVADLLAAPATPDIARPLGEQALIGNAQDLVTQATQWRAALRERFESRAGAGS